MRTLISTFAEGDLDRTLLAMRRLPYDRLVLVGHAADGEPPELVELRRLESLTGNEVAFERLSSDDFMDLVDELSDLVSRLSRQRERAGSLVMNISGGTKLVADAALFAAFRMGVPAYHVTDKVVGLPVMRGVTARNRFTPLQAAFVSTIWDGATIAEMEERLTPQSRQSLERVMRELRGMGLVSARLESGQVSVSLTVDGHEVQRALALSKNGA